MQHILKIFEICLTVWKYKLFQIWIFTFIKYDFNSFCSFEIGLLSVHDVWTDTQMQTHLRHLVIAHAANKLLENCAINCKKPFMNKINLRFRSFCSCSGKWKNDSKPFRLQKKRQIPAETCSWLRSMDNPAASEILLQVRDGSRAAYAPAYAVSQLRRAAWKIPVVLQCSAAAAWRMRPLLRIWLEISHSISVVKFSLNVAC